MSLPLLPMRPHFQAKVWGGQKLARIPNKGAPAGHPVGESWEVADLAEGTSTVADGAYKGFSLSDLVKQYGRELCGPSAVAGRFPLLVKLIDAASDLSIQVHPGRDEARRIPGARPKDEAWIILAVDPGGRVLHGLRPDVTQTDFSRAIRDGSVGNLMRDIQVRPGDLVHVQPGTFHAIGRGVLLLEIQEPSDTTFRVWDWGRLGLDGKPRELHVEQALEVGRFGPQASVAPPPQALGAGRTLLVDAGEFRIERLVLMPGQRRRMRVTQQSPLVVIPLNAPVTLATEDGGHKASPLSSTVVPAVIDDLNFASDTEAHVIVAGTGGRDLLQG